MAILSPSTILLALICVVAWFVSAPLTRRVRAMERDLSVDELKTFNDTHVRAGNRDDVPMKFHALLDTKKRLSRIWILSMLAIIAGIFAVVFLGPNLGLTL